MSHLTRIPGVPDSDQIRPGMAFYVGSGPKGAICGNCDHFGYVTDTGDFYEKSCAMYRKLAGHHGPRIEEQYRACKYYEKT